MTRRPALLAATASGLLYGLSYPSYATFHGEALAWIALVPWLVSVRRVDTFREYALRLALFTSLGCFIVGWSVMYAHVAGGAFALCVGWLVASLPFLLWYPVMRRWGWERGLAFLPFLILSIDRLYIAQPLNLPWCQFGHSQARLTWVIQQADLFGVWGITFWLAGVNAALAFALTAPTRRDRARRLAFDWLPLFAAPFLYAWSALGAPPQGIRHQTVVRVTSLQPNVVWQSPVRTDDVERRLAKHVAMTEQALADDPTDLLVWPENAILSFPLDDLPARNALFEKVRQWNTPLVTTLHMRDWLPPDAPGTPLLDYIGRRYRLYSAAALITPQLAAYALDDRPTDYLPVKTYHKRHLFALREFVPFSDTFPQLTSLLLTFEAGEEGYFNHGDRAETFVFQLPGGRKVRLGTVICIEQLYTDSSVDMVREGAQMLALLSDDSMFHGAPVAYQLAQFARIRAVETRRYIVRSANTGISFFINRFGQIYGQVAPHTATFKRSKMIPSNEITFYVRHPDLLPMISVGVGGVILLVTGFGRRRGGMLPRAAKRVHFDI